MVQRLAFPCVYSSPRFGENAMQHLDLVRRIAPQRSTQPRAARDPFNSGITFWGKQSLRKSLVITVALASLGVALQAPAANQQQERMKSCNAEAKSRTLSSTERKDFMQRCLSGQAAAPTKELNSQQQKMKDCNKEASLHGLKGTARQRFMSTCLK